MDESGRDGKMHGTNWSEAELVALFSGDDEVAKAVFNLLYEIARKSPVDWWSVDAT